MKKFIFYSLCLVINLSFGQPGKDGTLTVLSQNVIVNKYIPVTSNITAGSSTVQVASTQNLGLCPGDLVMIYQAQGASINTSNTSSYGSITNYNSAGLYEFKYVQSINGNIVTTQSSFVSNYQVNGKVQLIKVPQYSTLTVNANSSIISKKWQDTSVSLSTYRFGGIVALHANNIINNGTISSNGSGFRGGAIVVTAAMGITDFVSTTGSVGGEKGEGIFGYQQDYDINGGRYCRGAAANGGGGGNAHNCGGGGGGNGDNTNSWTGDGVMVVNSNNPLTAWQLDPDFIANGNSLTNSSGGGKGGYSWTTNNSNALTVGPNNSAWGGDDRKNVGGLGGRPLTNIDAESRIYFGGGGGSADANNASNSAGADGGGIVYLIASNGISGAGYITSNGSTALNTFGCSCDGSSGGGAGGSIVIKTTTISGTQTITASGGKGGDQLTISLLPNGTYASTPDEADGPGGGGSGGFVAISASGPVPVINGGDNGTTLSTALTEFISNGATKGASGQIGVVTNTFTSYSPIQTPVVVVGSNSPLCAGATLNLTTTAQGQNFNWAGPNGFSSSNISPVITNINVNGSGIYSLALPSGCGLGSTIVTTSVQVNPLPIIGVTGNFTICAGKSTTLTASGGNTYNWTNNQQTSTVILSPSQTTNYTVTVTNTITTCTNNTTFAVYIVPCDPTGVTTNTNMEPLISLYPNPINNELHLSVNFDSPDLYVEIYNELGQILHKAQLNSNFVVNTSNLREGLYFVKISEFGRVIFGRKIVKSSEK